MLGNLFLYRRLTRNFINFFSTEEVKRGLVLRDLNIKPGPEVSEEVLTTLSLSTANQKQKVQHNISKLVATYKFHQADTGNSAIQSIYWF